MMLAQVVPRQLSRMREILVDIFAQQRSASHGIGLLETAMVRFSQADPGQYGCGSNNLVILLLLSMSRVRRGMSIKLFVAK